VNGWGLLLRRKRKQEEEDSLFYHGFLEWSPARAEDLSQTLPKVV